MTFRNTKKRQQILQVLKDHHGTLSAKELHTQLPQIDLVTIYRNLDLFVAEKLIHKVHLDTHEVRYEHQQEPHHHAVCTNCKRVIHFTAADEQIKELLKLQDFDIDAIEVTVRGTCHHS